MNVSAITLSHTTIENLHAVEYQWVRSMYASGYSEQEMNHYIRQCFGGDELFASLFRKVALHQESLYVLLQHLGYTEGLDSA